MKTYMAKNFDSGLIHAYRKTGSFYKRRCGTTGKQAFITTPDAVTTVSAEWFVGQSDACRKCISTFDLPRESETGTDRSRSDEGTDSTGSGEVRCPVSGCEYRGPPASVAGHISGKKDAQHNWSELGYEGANDYKRAMDR